MQAVRQLLAPTTEQPPLQQQADSEAEARGFKQGSSNPNADKIDERNIASYAQEKTRLESGRLAAARDYDLMDAECPEVSSALDVIAEFSTQADDPLAETFRIESKDDALQGSLTERVQALKLDAMVTPAARDIAKYGGTFIELVADIDGQIVALKPLPNITMQRNEDAYGRLMPIAFKQVDPATNKVVAEFAAWQICHIRYQKIASRMYGNSLLEPARKVYKQISLMEDGMVVGRLYRSHVRYAFNVPVDGMNKDSIIDYIEELKLRFKKKMRFNTETGRIEQFESPMSAEEDFWLPTKQGVQSDVKVLQGQGNLSQIGDMEYFQNKLFATLKVPKAILGFERDVNAKSTLSTQDVNFARTLRRMQQVLAGGVREILNRVMICEGLDPATVEYTTIFPPVSTTDELVQWQTELIKSQVAEVYMLELRVIDDEYIYKKFLELNDDEIARLKEAVAAQKAQDQADAMSLAQASVKPVVPGANVAPAPVTGPPKAKPKPASSSERAQIRKIRALLQQDLHEAVRSEEVELIRLIKTAEQRFQHILDNGDE